MIKLNDKKDCCGCAACVQRCPKQCITMTEDEEGFLYPHINLEFCINCGLCEKVCPVLNQDESSEPLSVYAAKNPNEEIRMQSSSGGIFTMLAEQIISEGGVVFGVGFNKHWEAEHSYTETKEGLAAFRMSKYVQSIVGYTYKEAEIFLKQGRKVLYSGTPCQVAGLKKYLRKKYDNLITIDFICHGVPSPGVFRLYLSEELAKIAKQKNKFVYQSIPKIPNADKQAKQYGFEIKNIQFRNKNKGWKRYSFSLELSKKTTNGKNIILLHSSTLDKNMFLRGFLKDLYLRPSCHTCPAKNLKSGSDITIGDWWGIHNLLPDIDDDKGLSAIIINNKDGMQIINEMKLNFIKMKYSDLCKYNSALIQSVPITDLRYKFFNNQNKFFFERIDRLCKSSIKQKCKKGINKILKFASKLINVML